MNESGYIIVSATDIQAQAFRTIAHFVHENYSKFYDPENQITGAEGILVGIVAVTENMIAHLADTGADVQ